MVRETPQMARTLVEVCLLERCSPDGSHTSAKKHKAELIHKAKVKRAYFKMLQKDEPTSSTHLESDEPHDLGRFASEDQTNGKQSGETMYPTTSASAQASDGTGKRKKKLPYFYRPSSTHTESQPREVTKPSRTREQALEERNARRALWHRTSPSRLGKQRGQPDLGARMQVMLDKIQRTP